MVTCGRFHSHRGPSGCGRDHVARGEVRTASRCAGTLPAFLGPRAEPLRAVAPERVLGITLTAPQEKAWAQERAPGYAARRGVACQEGHDPPDPRMSVLLNGGQFCPQRACGNVRSCYSLLPRGCYWRAVGGSQGCPPSSYRMEHPQAEGDLSVDAESPAVRKWVPTRA